MNPSVQVFLYGSLIKAHPAADADNPIAVALPSPAPLPEILATLGIPAEEVQVAMVNHLAVSKNVVIQPADRVALFPMGAEADLRS